MTNRPADTSVRPTGDPDPAGAARGPDPARDLARDPDLADAVDGAATALAGIADALEHRTAAFPDPLLELLAESAAAHAESLGRALRR